MLAGYVVGRHVEDRQGHGHLRRHQHRRPVTDFMDGFVAGVNYYNKQKGTSVKVLGWDPVKKDGSFTGDFESTSTTARP